MEQVATKDIHAKKFAFSDFTHEAYKGYLKELIRKKFMFSFYDSFEKEGKFVLWRHDVDFSPGRALELAKIESELGVISTYFIQPHSRFYHLLEKENKEIFSEIKSLGHELGLHFDISFYKEVNEKNLNMLLEKEKRLIDSFFETDIKVFSFHNPTQFALDLGSWNCGGMINTYASYFKKNVTYGSDSNGIWRHNSIKEILNTNPRKLQFLTHPVWWTKEITSPRQRVMEVIHQRSDENIKSQLALWKKWERPLVDWE